METPCSSEHVSCFQEAASKVSEKVVSMVSKISALLVETLELGDQPVAIRLKKLVLLVRKQTANDMVREPVTSHIGGLQINGQLNVPPETCVVSKVVIVWILFIITARCTLVQSAVLPSYVVRLSVCLSVRP